MTHIPNEPPEFRPLSPAERTRCLMLLGWSEATLARKLCRDRNQVYRNRTIAGEEAAWIRKLTAFHEANPAPESVQRRMKKKMADAGLVI